MATEILCTLGPSSMNERVLHRLSALGVTLFRINLSHTPLDRLASEIRFVQGLTDVPICIDTEGAQIRTANFVEDSIALVENRIVRLPRIADRSAAEGIGLYPAGIVGKLKVGDFIRIDFDAALGRIVAVDDDGASMRVLSGGAVQRNRAVTVDRNIDLPPLTEKDRACVVLSRELGIRHFALSFANCGDNVDTLRALVGEDTFIISKIECRNGLTNLEDIATHSNALLIDRGDLSREVPIERIPAVQSHVLKRAKSIGRPVYVATNLLESMVKERYPTRAEVNDIYSTLADGADGLVMAAETAIGNYPIECAGMVVRVVHEFENRDTVVEPMDLEWSPLLVPPHGGALVRRVIDPTDIAAADALPRLRVAETDLLDCEQFAYGTYSPLTGFMDSDTLSSVLAQNRLPDGTPWTLPILLQVPEAAVRRYGPGDRVALEGDDGTVYALLDISESFVIDSDATAQAWFGTLSADHPGVARLRAAGPYCLGGAVTLVRELPTQFRQYLLAPAQTRFLFTHKGWSRIVGFHTRNPAHRGHEYLQLTALERTRADGLYINPVTGPKKINDFRAEHVLSSYQLMLDEGVYPPGSALLGAFHTFSRYAGPREAVFTALCRKNMGCSHFVVGRDHTGVGDFYAPDANRRLFDSLGDLGISPVYFDAVGYNSETNKYEESPGTNRLVSISGTEVREALCEGRPIPDWFMRDTVQAMLRAAQASGRELFH